MYTFTKTELYTSDEYDVLPEFVSVGIKPKTLEIIQKALQILQDTPELYSVQIKDQFFDLDINEDFEGKLRSATLSVMTYCAGVYSFYLQFNNDYTGTHYEADFSDEINALLTTNEEN